MNWSDWVALLACVAAVLALVPAFAPMLKRRKTGKSGKRAQGSIQPEESVVAPEPVKLNAFGKALVLTSYALAIGVIELVLFSAIAGIFGVKVDDNTMPINWLIAFYGLFLIPGVCLFWAAAHLFNLWEHE